MRRLKAAIAGWLLLLSSTVFSFDFNSSYYAVYEGPVFTSGIATGCRFLYVVPKPSLLILALDMPTPIQFMPQTTGFRSALCPNGSLTPFEKVALTANDMAGLGATLSSYKLFDGDFNGDGKPDFFLQGSNSIRNSVVLTVDGNGAPQIYYNFYGALDSTQYPGITVVDADGDGRSDIVAKDIYGNTMSFLNSGGGGFGEAGTGSSGNNLVVGLVGSIDGQFRVDESGAATYSVDIFAAPGTAGVQPHISLNYSSNDGDGIAGPGWSIGGVSAITRCRQTVAQDNNIAAIKLDAGDRFCLDGQRLMLTGGTYGAEGSTYRTEIDTYAVVTVVNSSVTGNPMGFKVVRKDGSISFYGAYFGPVGGDSQQVINGKVLTWSISRFEDSVKNAIRFSYWNSVYTNEHLVSRIDYAYGSDPGTATYSTTYLQFDYQNRPDASGAYTAGVQIWRTQRLTSIRSFSNGAELRNYNLVYRAPDGVHAQSFLHKLYECVGSTCLSPTTFDWKLNNGGFGAGVQVATIPGTNRAVVVPMDANDDGWMDLIVSGSSSRNVDSNPQSLLETDYTLYYQLSTVGGVGAAQAFFSGTYRNYSNVLTEVTPLRITDFNIDGRQDLIAVNKYGPGNFLGTAYGLASTNIVPPSGTTPGISDYNGDGMADSITVAYSLPYLTNAIRVNSGGYWTTQWGTPQFGTVAGASPAPPDSNCLHGTAPLASLMGAIDVDGDGRTDLPMLNQYTGCGSSGSGTGPVYAAFARSDGGLNFTLSNWVPGIPYATVDANGDGLTDLWVEEESPSSSAVLRFSTGAGFSSQATSINKSALFNKSVFPDKYLDYNGDGYPDLIYVSGDHLAVRIFNPATQGYGAEAAVNAGGALLPFQNGTYLKSDKYHYVDVDGDGHEDIVRISYLGSAGSAIWVYRSADAGGAGNRIVGIDNGLGHDTAVTYKRLSDSSVYTKVRDANNASYWPELPVFDVLAPIYVVSKVEVTAPTAHPTTGGAVNQAATSSISYTYTGQKMQAGGRGSLGFASIKVTDNQTGTATTTQYRQDFPFTGMPVWTVTASASNVVSLSEVNEYQMIARTGIGGAKYYQAYLKNKHYLAFDPLTAAETTYVVTNNSVPDTWGNVATVTTSTYSASSHTAYLYQKEVASLYGSADDQRYGRLTSSTVTHRRAGETPIVRTTTFTYYPTGHALAGLLWTERVSGPGSPPTKTTSHAYDAFGNETRVTHVATGATTRYAATSFDAAGRFVASKAGSFLNDSGSWVEKNIESVVSRNNYGQPTQVDGLNGLVTYFSYDALGREASRSDNTGAGVTTQYLRGGLTGAQYHLKTTANTGAVAAEYFDVLGRSIAKTQSGFDGQAIYSETEYDSAGRVKRQSAPHYYGDPVYWTANNYDAFRLLSQSSPAIGGANAITAFDYEGLTTTITNALSQTRTEVRNAAGQLESVTDHLGGTLSYAYNAVGDVRQTTTSGTQGGGAATISTMLDYDQLGRKTKMVDTDKGTWFYSYNGFGEVTNQYKVMSTSNYSGSLAQALSGGVPMQRTQMVYDARGRMVERSDFREGNVLESKVVWEYDTQENGVGQLHTDYVDVEDQMIGHLYAYDQYGREVTRINVNDNWYSEETSYDMYGRVSTKTDASGTGGTRSNYNAYGYLESLEELDSGEMLYEVQNMDALGNVATALVGNGATTTWSYDQGSGLLLNQTAVVGASTLQHLTYTWDVLGNQTSRWDHGLLAPSGVKNVRQSFCYDGLNRLLKTHQGTLSGSCSLTAAQQDQEYDSFGSIVRKTGVGTYTYNTSRPHQLQSTSDGVSYSYDNVGNMTSDSSGRTLAYTVFDKPSSISKGSDQIVFGYGIDRELLKRIDTDAAGTSTTYFIGDVDKVVKPDGSYQLQRSLAGVALWTHYFDSNGTETGVDKQYVYRDGLGSVVMITDENGLPKKQFAYDAWGRRVWVNNGSTNVSASGFLPVSSQLTTEGFTGHEMLDAIGLIHMQGRIYDQRLGRFVQADPVVQFPEALQSYNRYAYVLNAPLQYTDPTGYTVGLSGVNKDIEVTSCGTGCSGYSQPLQMPLNLGGASMGPVGSYAISVSFAANPALSGTSIWGVASAGDAATNGKPAKKDGQGSSMTGRASQGGGQRSNSQKAAEGKSDGSVTRVVVEAHAEDGDEGDPAFSMDAYKAKEWEELKEIFLTANQFNPFGPGEVVAGANILKGAVLFFKTTRVAPIAGKITRYTKHGLNQAISREGVGVAPKAMLDAVKNPIKTIDQANGAVKYVGKDAAVILNKEGAVITTYPRGSAGVRATSGGGP